MSSLIAVDNTEGQIYIYIQGAYTQQKLVQLLCITYRTCCFVMYYLERKRHKSLGNTYNAVEV